jgi:hypothetical protein
MPGTCVTIGEPGLKPSSRFQSVVSIGAPAALRGVASAADAQATAVAVDRSATVKKSLGHGSRQSAGSSGSHV